MKSYPDINVDPGFDQWIRATKDDVGVMSQKRGEGWSREKIFHDVSRYKFPGIDEATSQRAFKEWACWHDWFKAHPSPELLVFPGPICLSDGTTVSTEPHLSWHSMWAKLSTLAPRLPVNGEHSTANNATAAAADAAAAASAATAAAAGAASVAALRDLQHPARQALAG